MIRIDARELMHDVEMDVLGADGAVADVDDEYATIGLKDPKICVTTSRDPSSRLKQFAKEIKLIFPNSQTINRGNYRIDELVNSCKTADFSDLVIVNETRGMPDAMIVCHLPYGPTAYFTLTNCVVSIHICICTNYTIYLYINNKYKLAYIPI
jgi:U3 small nucleolar ribonucleoprotein protein IMP4